MDKTDYNELYTGKYKSRSADILKFWLMPFAMFVFFGFPTAVGEYVRTLSGFVAPCFFILSGFFILTPNDQERRKKLISAVKRYAIMFAIMFAAYLLLNLAYIIYVNDNWSWVPEIIRKRTAFEFLLFNVWPFPIGGNIWFIFSLLCASLIFLIADKLRLLNKPFVFITAFIVLFAFMLTTGEFAKITGFPYFGYYYIPGGTITRALPYMLLGMIIRRYANGILNIKRSLFPVFFVIGLALAGLELYLLNRLELLVYSGHLAGFCIAAVSVCCFALSNTNKIESFFAAHGRNYAKRIYYLCQPVYFFVVFVSQISLPWKSLTDYYWFRNNFGTLITYAICLLIAFAIGVTRYVFMQMKRYDRR